MPNYLLCNLIVTEGTFQMDGFNCMAKVMYFNHFDITLLVVKRVKYLPK